MDAQKFSRLDIPQPHPHLRGLQSTLRKLMRSGWHSNAAMRSIIDDYVRYHVVLVVASSLVGVAFLAASVGMWRRSGRSGRRTAAHRLSGRSAWALPRAALSRVSSSACSPW